MNIQIDIDKLLESTMDLSLENNSITLKKFEIDQLLEQTREW
ncbi:hypothetical protein R4Z09_15950 [Niallia oryzisoli]|uniref:Uncharacterized protein n=1 Tax=Niallia oryzisoli TaxID=1737571 RepID=A0ABZ2C5W3_9BACI